MSKLHTKLLAITQQSKELFVRMFARSLALAMLTAIGLMVVDLMVSSGMTDRYALVRRFPEFIPLMLAAVKLTFIEMSVFWARFAVSPQIDAQKPVREVQNQSWDNTLALAITHGINTLTWMFRVCVLIYLAQ